MSEQETTPTPIPLPKLPLLVVYYNQLEAYKQQRDAAEIKFQQAQGAIFACETMIQQYQESAKEAGIELKKLAEKRENLGKSFDSRLEGDNNGKVNDESEKQVAKK